jgi:hypothetical protein
MRLRPMVGIWLGALSLMAAPLPSFAQYYGQYPGEPGYRGGYGERPARVYDQYGRPLGYVQPQGAPQQPQPRRQGGYYPGMIVQPAQPQPQPGFSLRRLFGVEDEPPRMVEPQRPAPPRIRPDRPRPAPPTAVARQEKPKVDPSTHVVVFGDALADLTGQGLDDIFADAPEVAVVRKARSENGLARSDAAEWPKQIQDSLNGGQKITLAVVMIGANDRQSIREGDTTHEPLSDRWKQLYRDRVDGVMRIFQERQIPVVWIGVPPMKNDKLSVDYLAMNDIYRESVQRLGGTYVDIWPGFVNDENRYTATGPDVNGQNSRLRAGDGVLFTRAGARKAAHFADTEIKRIIEAKRTGTAIAAVPATPPVVEAAPGPAPDQPAAAQPAAPEAPAKPVAGPVLPLTRPDLSPGGTLVSGRPKLEGEAAVTVQRTLRDGAPPSPRQGRADDYRWPRS